MRILTTVEIKQIKKWVDTSYLIEHDKRYIRIPLIRKLDMLVNSFLLACELIRKRKKFDIVVTYFSNTALFFAILQRIFRKNRKPHLTMECHLEKKGFILNPLKALFLRQALKSINLNLVISKREIENYNKIFGLPKNKFRFIPFHYSLSGFEDIKIKKGDYIFSGGDHGRDYKNFLKAVSGLKEKVVIASYNLKRSRLKIPDNVEVITVSQVKFRELMAHSRIVVIPLDQKRIDSVGHQTYLNAIVLEKPLVVSDANGIRDLLTDEQAFIVKDNKEIKEFKESILKAFNAKPNLKAKDFVLKNYSLENFVENIFKEINSVLVKHSQ